MEFLASRVPMNYNARVVMYLRDVGVIGDAEASEILSAGAARSFRGSHRNRALVRTTLGVNAALCLAIAISGFAIQQVAGRFDDLRDELGAQSGHSVVPRRAGYLRVNVDPWAEVVIDGQSVFTTPAAAAIPLPPGQHYLRLKNPYFEEATREVMIVTGQTHVVDVELSPKHAAPTSDAKGAAGQ